MQNNEISIIAEREFFRMSQKRKKNYFCRVLISFLVCVSVCILFSTPVYASSYNSWTEGSSEERDLHGTGSELMDENNMAATDELIDQMAKDKSNYFEKQVCKLLNSLTYGLAAIERAGRMQIDTIVLGRVAKNVSVNSFGFDLSDGNIYGSLGALVYSILRNIMFGVLGIYFIYMLTVYLIKGTGISRANLKDSLYNFVFIFALLYAIPICVDYLLLFRDGALKLFVQKALSSSESMSFVDAIIQKASDDLHILYALLAFFAVLGSVWLGFNYIKIGLQQAYLFGIFPLVAFRSFSDKNILNKWFSYFFSNSLVPLFDSIGFVMMIYVLRINPADSLAGQFLALIIFFCIIPSRNLLIQLFGGPVPGRGFSLFPLALMAARMMGHGRGSKGSASSNGSDNGGNGAGIGNADGAGGGNNANTITRGNVVASNGNKDFSGTSNNGYGSSDTGGSIQIDNRGESDASTDTSYDKITNDNAYDENNQSYQNDDEPIGSADSNGTDYFNDNDSADGITNASPDTNEDIYKPTGTEDSVIAERASGNVDYTAPFENMNEDISSNGDDLYDTQGIDKLTSPGVEVSDTNGVSMGQTITGSSTEPISNASGTDISVSNIPDQRDAIQQLGDDSIEIVKQTQPETLQQSGTNAPVSAIQNGTVSEGSTNVPAASMSGMNTTASLYKPSGQRAFENAQNVNDTISANVENKYVQSSADPSSSMGIRRAQMIERVGRGVSVAGAIAGGTFGLASTAISGNANEMMGAAVGGAMIGGAPGTIANEAAKNYEGKNTPPSDPVMKGSLSQSSVKQIASEINSRKATKYVGFGNGTSNTRINAGAAYVENSGKSTNRILSEEESKKRADQLMKK